MPWTTERIAALRKRIRESEDSASRVLRVDPLASPTVNLVDVVAEKDAATAPTTLSEGVSPPVDPEVSAGLPHTLPLIKPRTV